MLSKYEKDAKDDLNTIIDENLKDFGSMNHMYQRKLYNQSLAYPTRFDNNDISGITDDNHISLNNQSALSIKLNKYKNDELFIMGPHQRRKSLNKDIPYEMKFQNQQIYGESMHIKDKKGRDIEDEKDERGDGNKDGGAVGVTGGARKPERAVTNRKLLTERRLSRISDNFNDDDLSDSFKDVDDNDRGKYQ